MNNNMNDTINPNLINNNWGMNMNNNFINMNNCMNNSNALMKYNNQFNNNNFSNNFNNNFTNTMNYNFSNPFNNFGNFNNNNFFYNFSNLYFMMSYLQNQLFQKRFYEMMSQQFMYNFIQKQSSLLNKNSNINNNKNNNINNNLDSNLIAFKDFKLSQALTDVLAESNFPFHANNDNNNLFMLPNDLNTELLTAFINLNPDLLYGFGNNLDGNWARNEYRGGKKYNPPRGWIGFGLNVLNKYDNGNNDWLACNGRIGEWCVAYHGAGRGQNNDNIKKTIKSILESNLKPGKGQSLKNSPDLNHPGQTVGIGVYCSPDIDVLESYAGVMTIQGKSYKVGFMLRVKPDKIRFGSLHKNYWVLNGSFDELRPYRLLVKRIS
jgi:hypothetical protein